MRTLILSRPDRIGDVVISTSCLAPIREKYPNTKIYFVAADRMRPLLEGHPLLDGFIPLSADLRNEFQRLNASAIVHLHPNANCYAAAALAEVPLRIGYASDALVDYLTHVVPERRKEGRQHEAEYNFDLLAYLGQFVPVPKKLTAQVHLPEGSRETLQQKVPWPMTTTAFAVLHPTAHSKFARWPMERFVQIADRLEKNFQLKPVFISANREDSFADSRWLNLAGKTDLGELGWLLKHARVLVTNDSGPAHLAAAVGCPVVSIFGRNAPLYGPVRWRPLSDKAVVVSKPLEKRWFESREKHWRRCFEAITVDEVEAAVREALTNSLTTSASQ